MNDGEDKIKINLWGEVEEMEEMKHSKNMKDLGTLGRPDVLPSALSHQKL